MNNKISIVVPVYNVEKYLNKCIDSILNQTKNNFELILVNDGSTDSSGDICDEYKLKYPNIEVIHKNNGGLSSARDAGIYAASGEYIMFVDSDDWIEPNTIEILNGVIAENKYDVIIYGLFMDFEINNFESYAIVAQDKVYNSIELYLNEFEMYRSSTLFGYAWNKLYKLNIIKMNKLEFGEYVYPEDVYFNFKILPYCNNIRVVNKSLYHYIHRERETLSKLKRDTLLVSNQVYDKTVEFLKMNNSYEVNEIYVNTTYLESIMLYIVNVLSLNKNYKKDLDEIYNDIKVRNALSSFSSKVKFFKIMYIFMKYKMVLTTVRFLKIYRYIKNKSK